MDSNHDRSAGRSAALYRRRLSLTDAAAQTGSDICWTSAASRRPASASACAAPAARDLAYSLEYADEIEKFDEVVVDKGVTVLIDPKAVMFLIGSEMDFRRRKTEIRLHLQQPQ